LYSDCAFSFCFNAFSAFFCSFSALFCAFSAFLRSFSAFSNRSSSFFFNLISSANFENSALILACSSTENVAVTSFPSSKILSFFTTYFFPSLSST
jgi:hypothetical protein